MTKRELVIRVANKIGQTQSDIGKVVEATFEALSQALAEGKRWELRDFGVFEVKTRASRIGRNPRTGDQVPVPQRRVVTFRPGKKMKEAVAEGRKKPSEPSASTPTPAARVPEPPQSSSGRNEPPTSHF